MTTIPPPSLRRPLLASILAIAAAAAAPADAALVSYRFGGVAELGGGLGPQRFSGELHYDNAWPDSLPGHAGYGVYEAHGGLARLSLSIGLQTDIVNTHVTVTIGDGTGAGGADQFTFVGQDDVTGAYMGFLLAQAAGTLFGDDRLSAVSTLSIADFDAQRLFFRYEPGAGAGGGEGRQIQGQLDALHCISGCPGTPGGELPEPATLALLPLAAAAAGLARRRRMARGARP